MTCDAFPVRSRIRVLTRALKKCTYNPRWTFWFNYKRHFEALGRVRFTSVWSDMTFVNDDGGREKFLRRFEKRFFARIYPSGGRIDPSTTIFFILPSAAVLRGRATRRYEIRPDNNTYITRKKRGRDILASVSHEIWGFC